MRRIIKEGKNCQGVYEARETGLLIDGSNYYSAFYHAAAKARRYILLAGWQFDSDVRLLRSEEEGDGAGLLSFLGSLCEGNTELEIYILAWDFSVLYSLDREWFQRWLFNWSASGRIHFRFDSNHAVGASHHQKFVVIDGALAFAGGMDICSHRWDDRCHLRENPLRKDSRGKPYEPYHDIQACLIGPVARKLSDLFALRWESSGGGRLDLPHTSGEFDHRVDFSVPLTADRVALSRTQARTLPFLREPVQEIRSIYLDAIDAAERLIYIENQYFSSQAVYKALMDRLRAPGRSRLQIVIILPRKPHALIEEIALGLAQTKMLNSLDEEARKNGHSMGIYYSTSPPGEGESEPTYIHAKLLLVDDRFLTVGSANITNRSMGLDTELNVSWEADPGAEPELLRSVRRVRMSLLAEHTGASGYSEFRKLAETAGLVERLDVLAGNEEYQLKRHTMETYFAGASKWLEDLRPEDLAIDPEKPVLEENVYEMISADPSGLFSEGIQMLHEKKTLWVLIALAALVVLVLVLVFLWMR